MDERLDVVVERHQYSALGLVEGRTSRIRWWSLMLVFQFALLLLDGLGSCTEASNVPIQHRVKDTYAGNGRLDH